MVSINLKNIFFTFLMYVGGADVFASGVYQPDWSPSGDHRYQRFNPSGIDFNLYIQRVGDDFYLRSVTKGPSPSFHAAPIGFTFLSPLTGKPFRIIRAALRFDDSHYLALQLAGPKNRLSNAYNQLPVKTEYSIKTSVVSFRKAVTLFKVIEGSDMSYTREHVDPKVLSGFQLTVGGKQPFLVDFDSLADGEIRQIFGRTDLAQYAKAVPVDHLVTDGGKFYTLNTQRNSFFPLEKRLQGTKKVLLKDFGISEKDSELLLVQLLDRDIQNSSLSARDIIFHFME